MPPIYSKRGCYMCRSRKKKCDEGKPFCQACMRLNVPCSYTDPTAIRARPVAYSIPEHVFQSQPLPETLHAQQLAPITFHNDVEKQLLGRAPAFLTAFSSVAGSSETRDSNLWMQILVEDAMVRNAALSTMAGALQLTSEQARVYFATYGRALHSIRTSLACPVDEKAQAVRVVALTFMALRESTGPEPVGDSFMHFDAIMTLLSHVQIANKVVWSLIPTKLWLWVLEGALYHMSRVGMFSDRLLPLAQKWERGKFYATILEINGHPESRVKNSPLMNGQYKLSQLIFKALCLHRMPGPGHVSIEELNALETERQEYQMSLSNEFTNLPEQSKHSLRSEYQISCISLQICITALHAPSAEIGNALDYQAAESLSTLFALPIMDTNHFGLLWGIQILACATRAQEDFERLQKYYQDFRSRLDPGHRRRANLLFTKLERLRLEADQAGTERRATADPYIPIGLSVLQDKKGVLA